MITTEIVDNLNNALNDNEFDSSKFRILLKMLIDREKSNVKIIDFEIYNKDSLARITEEKIKCVKSQDFELASTWRNKEKKISKVLDLQKEFDIKSSRFHFEKNLLFYFHVGTEKNDKEVKDMIKRELQ